MEGKRFIHKIKLTNFLSYGSDGEEIELQPLNVLIGANTSGKSNLIEAMGILKATPTDLSKPFREGGGIDEFLWKGTKEISSTSKSIYPLAKIEAIVDSPGVNPLLYELVFSNNGLRLDLINEVIDNKYTDPSYDISDIYDNFYYRYNSGKPVLRRYQGKYADIVPHYEINPDNLVKDQSILSQRRDPELYPELYYLSTEFYKIGLYRDWQIGRYSEPRKSQPTDLLPHPLEEDGSNLGLFLNDLKSKIGSRKIIEKLKKFYEPAEELDVKIYGGTVQIIIREEGLIKPIPATRLSNGTLRYLFLMALLLDPTPPPLICIEEPEIGLHPDILPTIAEMLIEASQRTQLIITTHSDTLVSALSEYPESVIVCERDNTGTHLRRLDPGRLKKWLENYTLGELWRMGEIGGNRW